MPNALVVYGSETGTAKSAIKEIIGDWKKSCPTITCSLKSGNEAAAMWDTVTSSAYQYIIVATSSYGDGDPPSGYEKFLFAVQNAAKESPDKLKGIEHSVLGFGSTSYETFMNCPRLTDRALGLAGSRRCLMRAEVDEMAEDPDEEKDKWVANMTKVLKGKANPQGGEVCGWDEPGSKVLEKNLGPDGFEVADKVGASGPLIPILVAVAAAAYYFLVVKPKQDMEREE